MDEKDTNSWLAFLVVSAIVFLTLVMYVLTGGEMEPGWGGMAIIASVFMGIIAVVMYRTLS